MKPRIARLCRLLLLATAWFMVSCVSSGTHPLVGDTMYLDPTLNGQSGGPRVGPPPDTVSFWDGGSGNGPSRIRIKLSEQIAYFYRGDVLVGRSKLSTGDANHPTPTGSLSILEKNKYHKSGRYGDYIYPDGTIAMKDIDNKKDKKPPGAIYDGAKMTHFMRVTWDGVGMHEGFLPGYPASHGCIRMPAEMARIFFENVSLGTPVLITQ